MTSPRLAVTDETTVGEVLEVSPATEVIFEAYGCNPTWECTEEHRGEYQVVELTLTCHIKEVETLVADLNAFLEFEDSEADAAPEPLPSAAQLVTSRSQYPHPSQGVSAMSQPPHRDRPLGETAGSPQRPARRLVGPALHFDLSEELASLKEEPSWREGDRNARTLVEEPSYRVVLTALKAGAQVREHRAPGWVTIHAIAGHLRLRLPEGEVIDLPAGGLLVLQPRLPHDVEALEESAFLLAVAGPDSVRLAD